MRAHLCSDSHEEASHAEACAEANCRDFAANVLHSVMDCQRRHHLVNAKYSIRFWEVLKATCSCCSHTPKVACPHHVCFRSGEACRTFRNVQGQHDLLVNTAMITSPPEQLMYSCMSLWFSESRYSMVATSWLPSSSSTALLKKMMRSRYCSQDSLRD